VDIKNLNILKNKKLMLFLMIVFIVITSFLVEMFFIFVEDKMSVGDMNVKAILIIFLNNINIYRIVVTAGIISMITFAFYFYDYKKMGEFLYQYRYLLSGVLFVFLIIFEVHGSSVGFWQNYFQNSVVKSDALIGVARGIRSDEWAVNTPMMLSQYFNHTGLFPYFSETIRGATTDAFIVYGQPVRDLAIIFRPFHWGYLFLSPEKGLSFFWTGRVIALFLTSFEFGMLLTKKNKALSLAYAALITWAPIVQWWFAINGLVEMLVFGQLALILISRYMNNKNYLWRCFYGFILIICAGGYVLSFYPAWQVPLAYVFLALLLGVVMENWGNSKWGKKDAFILISVVFLLGIGMVYVLSKSIDTVASIMGTVYPGSRFETGGGQLSRLLLYPGNLFFSIATKVPFSNVCELSVFFDFFPAGILLSLWILLKEKKRDVYLILLLVLNAVFLLWCFTQWPDWLAKITLLSYTQAARAFLAVGFLNILLLIRSLALMTTAFSKWATLLGAGFLGITITLLSAGIYKGYIPADTKMILILIPILSLSFFFIFNGSKGWAQKSFLIMSLCIVFISGMFVNPVTRGLDVIYSQDIVKEISAINEKESGLWIVDAGSDSGFPIINIPLMVGAPTINSTNVYPDLDRWYLLDPDKSYEDIYNRYAHISMNIVENEPESTFELTFPDQFRVNLNVSDLKLLEIRFVLSRRELSAFSNENISFNEIARANGFMVYEIQYN